MANVGYGLLQPGLLRCWATTRERTVLQNSHQITDHERATQSAVFPGHALNAHFLFPRLDRSEFCVDFEERFAIASKTKDGD